MGSFIPHKPSPRQENFSCRGTKVAGWRYLIFDLGAGRFDLLLDLFGFLLGDAFLDRLRSALDERLASARPRPATQARTSLMTAILFAPASLRMTSKAVFSSAGAAAAHRPQERRRRPPERLR